MWFFSLSLCREAEKRAAEKKPAGTLSPPSGSPSVPSQSTTIRVGHLPYSMVFGVLLQCLKQVRPLLLTAVIFR